MSRILLVEDNEMNRDMLARRLRARGFQVDIACDGAAGIDRTAETLPDIVLMDMSLPKVNGALNADIRDKGRFVGRPNQLQAHRREPREQPVLAGQEARP